MKKLLAIVAAAFAFNAMAAVEKVVVVESADIDGLVKVASKAGELVGYPMLGALASGALAANPYSMAFGPMRADSSAYVVVYVDTAEKDLDKLEPEIAVVWPVARGKAAFVASNPGCKEVDGAIAVADIDDDDDDDEDASKPSEPDYTYTAFSADGKWATTASTSELAKKALEVAGTSMRTSGEFVHVAVTPAGMTFFKDLLSAKPDLVGGGDSASGFLELSKMLSGFDGGLALTDDGLTVTCNYIPAPGTAWDSSFRKPFESCPLCKLNPGAFAALAMESGICGSEGVEYYEKLIKAVNEAGVKTDFLKIVNDGGRAEWTFDCAAFFKFTKDGGPKAVDEKLLSEKMQKVQNEAVANIGKLSEKPQSWTLGLAGKTAPVPPVELFKSILPDVAEKRPCTVAVVAPAAFMLAIAPDFVAQLTEEQQSKVKPLLAMLPYEAKGGIASAAWRDGGKIASVCRVSAAEIKTIAAIVNAFIAAQMVM